MNNKCNKSGLLKEKFQNSAEIKKANALEDQEKFNSNPIKISISGAKNTDLTLIDFPGVVADPNDREIIFDMIKPAINKDTCIILAVSR